MSLMDAIEKERKMFNPNSGFNLVGLNDYGLPGEQMYLIAHFETIEEAEIAQRKHKDSMILGSS
jgi:hypothetical protein